MTSRPILLVAFENAAGHIANLEIVKQWVDELLSEGLPLAECILNLQERSMEEDVTFRTDIRILINEIEHISREKTSG
ncbi:MAG: hypothetical protein ACFFED_08110 [Candidatus Thorarchaeota archaeon]